MGFVCLFARANAFFCPAADLLPLYAENDVEAAMDQPDQIERSRCGIKLHPLTFRHTNQLV
jgi:hypothetical protein